MTWFSPSIERLAQRGDLAGLVRAIGHRRGEVRRRAVRALGSLGDQRVFEPLSEAARDPDAGVRLEALRVLGELKDGRGRAALLAALGESEAETRRAALRALAVLGDQQACPAVAELLQDPAAEVRGAALETLLRLDHAAPAMLEPLAGLLEAGSDPELMQLAARMLGRLRDARALEALCRALASAPRGVCGAAAWALSQIGGERALQALLQALGHPDEWIRWQAAGALGDLGDPQAIEPLCFCLEDPHQLLRNTAALALVKIGGPRAAEALRRALGAGGYNRGLDPLTQAAVEQALPALWARRIRGEA